MGELGLTPATYGGKARDSLTFVANVWRGTAVLDRVYTFEERYSCFEKGCPTKPYATMPKGIMGNEGSWSLIEALGVSAT